MAVEVDGLDVELLRSEIQRTYAAVSREPDRDFMFPTGRAWARDLGYPAELLARIPAGALLEAEYESRLLRYGFTDIETGDLVDTYARSAFEDTRQKAEKFGV